MTRFAEETFSNAFLSRPARVAVAMRIAFVILAANVSFTAAKALLASPPQTASVVAEGVSTVAPFILPISASEAATPSGADCHSVDVETDEGYGVRGHILQTLCR